MVCQRKFLNFHKLTDLANITLIIRFDSDNGSDKLYLRWCGSTVGLLCFSENHRLCRCDYKRLCRSGVLLFEKVLSITVVAAYQYLMKLIGGDEQRASDFDFVI
jgi:hypothetical protein